MSDGDGGLFFAALFAGLAMWGIHTGVNCYNGRPYTHRFTSTEQVTVVRSGTSCEEPTGKNRMYFQSRRDQNQYLICNSRLEVTLDHDRNPQTLMDGYSFTVDAVDIVRKNATPLPHDGEDCVRISRNFISHVEDSEVKSVEFMGVHYAGPCQD